MAKILLLILAAVLLAAGCILALLAIASTSRCPKSFGVQPNELDKLVERQVSELNDNLSKWRKEKGV